MVTQEVAIEQYLICFIPVKPHEDEMLTGNVKD